MKTISKTFASAILALSVSGVTTSCSSDNDDESNTIQTESETLNDQQAMALAENALFEYYHKAFGLSFIVETFTSKTHSFEGPESADGPLISRHELTPTNIYFVNRWYNKNSAVSNANDAIEKITAATGVGEQTKKEAIARAKLARALGYHVLVRLWGEVPLYTSTDGDTKTRASIDAIYTQIVKDLEEAAEGLPASASLPSVPTKAAAYGLLSRVYLDWGSNPLTYDQLNAIKDQTTDPTPSYTPARLEKAVEYANKVTGYKLNSSFASIWGKDNEATKDEKILTFVHDGDAVGTGKKLRCFPHELMLLIDAVEKRRRKRIKPILSGKACRLLQAPAIAHTASPVGNLLSGKRLFQKVPQHIILIHMDFHMNFLGELFCRHQPLLPLLIGMDVWIEKVPHRLDSLFPKHLYGIAGTWAAAHMQ